MPPRDHFRAFARRLVALEGSVSAGDAGSTYWVQPARVIDLGLGGARLSVAQAIPLGTPVDVAITAPHLWDPLVIRAEVAWVAIQEGTKSARVGVRFQHRAGATLRALTDLLAASVYR